MTQLKAECPYCKSSDTEIEVDESFDYTEEETLTVTVVCHKCKGISHFPEELDWRNYE